VGASGLRLEKGIDHVNLFMDRRGKEKRIKTRESSKGYQ
jgi:hypothetical protein